MRVRLLRVGVSAGVLALLLWWLDAGAVLRRLGGLRPVWVALALAISVPQMALLALRWRITAGRLGIDLPFRSALAEYYLGVFLNQVLPGGVVGDATRAWRNARSSGAARAPDGVAGALGPAVRAVILERASAQVVMAGVALLALGSVPLAFGARTGPLLLAAGGFAAAFAAALWLARRRMAGALGALWRDARAALLALDVVGVQLATAVLVVASYLATYLVAARAVGVETPFVVLLPLVPPVLVSMLLPVSVAGWGVREATAAGVWSAVGLSPVDAVAISACYGLLVLLGSLPGALVLVSAGPGRRGGPRRDESDGSAAGGPRRGSRSREG